jgi:hypothetical protein
MEFKGDMSPNGESKSDSRAYWQGLVKKLTCRHASDGKSRVWTRIARTYRWAASAIVLK